MARAPRILMAGGGTGGHVYPALAIADAVVALRPDAVVAFAGTRERLEATAVPKAGYPFHPITVAGFQRSLSARNLSFPLKLARGLAQSWALVGRFDPHVAVGTGGYVAGPVLLAAWLRGRPLLVQEQNAYAGVTNRLLARLARRIHLAFPEAKGYVPAARAVVSGNPTRDVLRRTTPAEGRAHFGLPEDARAVLVFGGSLGSAALNAAFERHAAALLATDERLHLLWQAGTRYHDALAVHLPSHPRLRLMPYIDRMDAAYAAADLVVCRAGAITCSELMVTGTPAVLVPSPNVVADHQTKNARSLADAGAAVLLPEPDLTSALRPTVEGLLADAARRAQMADALRRRARPHAARRIARDVLALAGFPGSNDEPTGIA
jgi:UDP-N-acetylglucosamine--N-acetylmuramyl-(pentapeptide) pyrophosphoryl-undecaprenol N-acetylglucosamine transferase